MNIPSNVFQNTVLYASFGMAILGSRGNIRMGNKALEEMFGKDSSELLEQNLANFFFSEYREKYTAELEAIRSGRITSSVMELSFNRSDDEVRWCKANLQLIPHPDNKNWVLTACLEDITDHHKLIQQLTLASRLAEKARDEAELATKTKSEFLANTSHEIRTPIHTIIGMTELMLDTALDPEQQEYTEQVQFSADVLLSLINDILDFEKIEAGKLKLEAIEMSLLEILENAMDLVVLEGHRKGLEMILDVDIDVPDKVSGDPVRLRQILVNLVNNAIKFTASGEIHVSVRVSEISKKSVELKFLVRDTGIGISSSKKNKLFKEFSQVDSSTTRKYGGTGLGLSISKNLSLMMGGNIGVESEEGEGASFWFTARFPLLPDEDRNLTMDRFPDHRVLIVDDNPTSRIVLQGYIEHWGCRVETAVSGEEALNFLETAITAGDPFHSCFVDLIMPRMDGWHFANEVKTSEKLKDTVLFLMSPAGRGTIEPKMKLLNWYTDYLDKPVKPSKFFLAYCRHWEEGEIQDLEKTKIFTEVEKTLGTGNILVAEDHEVNQQLFKTILENLEQRVTLANNGLEAVQAVEKEEFDIIFMDVQMPEMNGYEATMKIREMDVATPIIAVTASAIKGEKDKCLSVGMTDFLTKPFKKKDIIPVLNQYLEETAACLEELEPLEELDCEEPFVELALAAESPAGDVSRDVLSDLSKDPLAIFDYEEALDTFMGKEEIVKNLLNVQVKKISEQIPVMEIAFKAGEWQTLRESAHSIKGGSWNLQAKQIGDCAFEVETAAREEDSPGAERGLYRIKEAFRRFQSRVAEIV